MSLTLTPVINGENVEGRHYSKIYDITPDTSYPLTNGYVINATDVGLKAIFGGAILGSNKAGGAVLPVFDLGTPGGLPQNSLTFRLFLPSGGATAPATLTAPVVAVTEGSVTISGTATGSVAAGSTPVTSTAANGAIVSVPAAGLTGTIAAGSGALTAGIGKEVGNTTNVAALTYRVKFVGF